MIRHATNLTIDDPNKYVQTLFIGNVIDNNVSNIFRACSHISLKHSQHDEETLGIKIFPITIDELIKLLEKNKTDKTILSMIKKANKKGPEFIKSGRSEPIMEKILAEKQ